MGKGGCGRSASNLSTGQTMRAATTSLHGGRLSASRGRLGAGGSGTSTASGTSPSETDTGDTLGRGSVDDDGWLDWIDQDKYEPRPNAQPGAWLPVMRLHGSPSSAMRDSEKHVVLQTMKWGIYPHYKKEPPGHGAHFQMFNARSEDGVKAQKRLVGRKQCVIISAGFYEFKEVEGRAPGVFTGPKTHKQGYYVHFKGSSTPMYFAGLYDTWRQKNDPEATALYTCTILTTEPSEKLRWLHNRMPVILDTNEKVQQWLSATAGDDANIAALSKLYVGCNSPELTWHPVTRELNSARYQGRDCMDEISLGSKNSMRDFFKPVRSRKQSERQEATAAATVIAENPAAEKAVLAAEPALASASGPKVRKGFGPVGASASQIILRPCGQPICASAGPVFMTIPIRTIPMPTPLTSDDSASGETSTVPYFTQSE